MKQYKEFRHVVNRDRFSFEESLAKDMRKIKENGYGIEVQYHPVCDEYGLTFCALVLGYIEE